MEVLMRLIVGALCGMRSVMITVRMAQMSVAKDDRWW
jgi:hypothetical protein